MKGIILSGGRGSRLYPATLGVSKQLIPVYNKPMLYYPLSLLMMAGVRDFLIISTPEHLQNFRTVLRGGSQFGVTFKYEEQEEPRGIAEAFYIGEEFLQGDSCFLVLGDNIIYGDKIGTLMENSIITNDGATIFAYRVQNPSEYGVVEMLGNKAVSIEEKPKNPKSHFAIPGVYIYDSNVVGLAKTLKPSARGELEISDLNRLYMESGKLRVCELGRGIAWLDAGTHETLAQASAYVQAIENRQGLLVCSPEEVAYRKGYITNQELKNLANALGDTDYSRKLMEIAKGEG